VEGFTKFFGSGADSPDILGSREQLELMPCNCQKMNGPAAPAQPAAAKAAGDSRSAALRPAFVSMRYTGPTATTVAGAVSGRRYRFGRTGTVLKVDPRDQAALAQVPHLRRV